MCKKGKGRPSKILKEKVVEKDDENDTESGEDCETEEEKLSCLVFSEVITTFHCCTGI